MLLNLTAVRHQCVTAEMNPHLSKISVPVQVFVWSCCRRRSFLEPPWRAGWFRSFSTRSSPPSLPPSHSSALCSPSWWVPSNRHWAGISFCYFYTSFNKRDLLIVQIYILITVEDMNVWRILTAVETKSWATWSKYWQFWFKAVKFMILDYWSRIDDLSEIFCWGDVSLCWTTETLVGQRCDRVERLLSEIIFDAFRQFYIETVIKLLMSLNWI